MLDELKPHDLHASAQALGVHPFEVVRLLVLSGSSVDRLGATSDTLDKLRDFGQLETWWTDRSELPNDDNSRRRVVRGVVDAMLQRELVGEHTTRLDNLWRGLPSEDREVAEHAVMVMHELGHLTSQAATSGTRVSIHPDAVASAKDLVARGNAPDDLAALWAE